MAIPIIHLSLDLEMVLNHPVTHALRHNLHQEVDKKKDLSPHRDLVVVLILKLASTPWLLLLRVTLRTQDTRALQDLLKRPLAQQLDLSMFKKCLYRPQIQTDSRMYSFLVGASDAIRKTTRVEIAQSLQLHVQASVLTVAFYIMTLRCVHIKMTSLDLGVILDHQVIQGLHQLIVPHRNRNDKQGRLTAISPKILIMRSHRILLV